MRDKHPKAGKTVVITSGEFYGQQYRVEDYWENVAGKSWMTSNGNPAAMEYAFRSGMEGLPVDNEVVYGKVGILGKLIHTSQLGEVE